ncbi:hypothetical protein MID00_19945 [Alcaligenes sp. NLF5-7]|uniref:hypothetical protein n=1 Tax=Alcaligenes sp. NLF5-7 TaxID=2918755 RepID=UPI0020C33260|nr:hypothetical protein [Alcaligenes sp. NLF5-7]UTM01726.1 hypothetical protein MID00_19945 [Alcaligenes sp. NLF5-7]
MAWCKSLLTSLAFKVFVLSSFASGAIASLFLYPIKEAGHAAAWVQAVGSIAAILGAIYAARESAKTSARLKEERHRRGVLAIIDSFFVAVKNISGLISVPHQHVNPDFYASYSSASFNGFLRNLDIVPVLELPTPAAMSSMLGLQIESKLFVSAADALVAGPWSPKNQNYSQLVDARDKFNLCLRLLGGQDFRTLNAEKRLENLESTSFRQLKDQVLLHANAIKSNVKVLRQDLR